MTFVIILLMIAFGGSGMVMVLGYWLIRKSAGDFDFWDLIGLRLLSEFLDFSKSTTAHTMMRFGIIVGLGSYFALWMLLPQ